MGFQWFVAKRHLIAKKKHNAVNIISTIAMVGVAICSLALVVVLSVFNGFESMVSEMYSTLDTDLRLVPTEGKGFNFPAKLKEQLSALPELQALGEIVEEDALFGYNSLQHIGQLTGVDAEYIKITKLADHVLDGKLQLHHGSAPLANIGSGVAYYLRISLAHYDPIEIYLPNRAAKNWLNPSTAFNQKKLALGAVVGVNAEYDTRAVIIPIETARELLCYDADWVSYVAISAKSKQNIGQLRKSIEQLLPCDIAVLNRYQQNADLYKTVKSEKLIITLILGLILFIATFNVVGSLSMLVIDKRQDIATLSHLGATGKQIRGIFLCEGLLISLGGGAVGIALGLLLCWLQSTFGLITLQGQGTFVVQAYPVEVRYGDLVVVLALTLALGFLASWVSTRAFGKRLLTS